MKACRLEFTAAHLDASSFKIQRRCDAAGRRSAGFMKGNGCTVLLLFYFPGKSVTFQRSVGTGRRKQDGEPMTTSGCDFGGMVVKYEKVKEGRSCWRLKRKSEHGKCAHFYFC